MNDISPATHVWRGSSGKLNRCRQKKCGRQTTGIVKDTKTGKVRAMCGECAQKAKLQ